MTNLPPGCTAAMLDDAWGDPRPSPPMDCECPKCHRSDRTDNRDRSGCHRCRGRQLTTEDLTEREYRVWLDDMDRARPTRQPCDDDGTDSPQHRFGVDA